MSLQLSEHLPRVLPSPLDQFLVITEIDLDALEEARKNGTVRPLLDRSRKDTSDIEARVESL